jgi:hypothetical protein
MFVRYPHVPDHEVGQIVGVVEAAAAGLRNDAVRQVVGGEAEVRDRLIVVLDGGPVLAHRNLSGLFKEFSRNIQRVYYKHN